MNLYIPYMYKKNIKDIDYLKLKKNNIKCLLFDLDNTIISYYDNVIKDDIINLFDDLKKDFIVFIFSNSNKKRVSKFNRYLNLDIIYSAKKPLSINFKKVLKNNNLQKSEVAIIGDQLMTDIRGGNNVGIMTILVDPLEKKETIFTKFNRILERHILKKNQLKRGSYYD